MRIVFHMGDLGIEVVDILDILDILFNIVVEILDGY